MDPYVSGGYFLTRLAVRDDRFMSRELLPPTFATLSDCFTDFAFDFWWNDENAARAHAFGVAEDRIPDLISWYLHEFDHRLGAPNVAYSIAVIAEFIAEFVEDRTDLVVLGCGVSEDHREHLLAECRTPAEFGEYGVFNMLERRQALEGNGNTLGFEIMSYEYGLEHSWVCNSLESEVHSRLGIAPNPTTGLLDSYEEAVAAANYINSDGVGAEPGLWLPWLVVEYPL